MKKIAQLLLVGVLSFLPFTQLMAEEKKKQKGPWETFGVNFGVFLSKLDTSVRTGSGLGVDLDVEKFMGLESSDMVARLDALWRFSKNKKHRLDLTWFSFHRKGKRAALDDFTIEVPGEPDLLVPTGTEISSYFNLDIYQGAYSYSFFQDERIDLAAVAGLYIMPIDFGIDVSGLLNTKGKKNFTAPLPVVGYRMDIALTPEWFVRTGSQLFYIEFGSFTGSLLEVRGAVEYLPFENWGFGLGLDSLKSRMESDKPDFLGVDVKGNVAFDYTGLQLYARYFF